MWKAKVGLIVSRFTLAGKMNMPVNLEPNVAAYIAGLLAEMAVLLDAIYDAAKEKEEDDVAVD